MTDSERRARRLGDILVAGRTVTDPLWRAAFEETPRHVFVPAFYRDDGTRVDGADVAAQEDWLDAVYADTSLTTQLAPVPGTDLCWPVSSTTQPSLMARMLHLLDLSSDSRVLEIGTGTGYNAALLCFRLGDRQVTSIDIDPELVVLARGRLAELGYHPHLVTGDGSVGVADDAPYDRIIATCAVPTIPLAWIRQLVIGGLIVADLRGEISSNLASLRKAHQDTVRGKLLATPGHFMWLRAQADNPLRDAGSFTTVIDLDHAGTRSTTLDPAQLRDSDLRFALQAHLPDADGLFHLDGAPPTVQLRTADGSWAEVSTDATGRHRVVEGGPRRIWSIAEDAADWWTRQGRPARSRFGLTATTDGKHQLWLDNPDSPYVWPLPLAPP
jgi:methyltransferase of ATP-grasp peptide maturase system